MAWICSNRSSESCLQAVEGPFGVARTNLLADIWFSVTASASLNRTGRQQLTSAQQSELVVTYVLTSHLATELDGRGDQPIHKLFIKDVVWKNWKFKLPTAYSGILNNSPMK